MDIKQTIHNLTANAEQRKERVIVSSLMLMSHTANYDLLKSVMKDRFRSDWIRLLALCLLLDDEVSVDENSYQDLLLFSVVVNDPNLYEPAEVTEKNNKQLHS